MRLLYDASVFGFAAEQASGRTGIYRVAERILRGIGRYPEVDLHVCATSSWTLLQSARSSFGANSPWPMARLASSGRADEYGGVLQWASRGLLRAIERLNQGIGKSSTEKHLWARAARRGCAIGVAAAAREMRRVDCWNSTHIDRLMSEFDVFHSPFHALPLRKKRRGSAARFLTFYDLIPLKFPELCTGTLLIDNIKKIIASVTEEDWVFSISEHSKRDLCDARPDLSPSRILVTPLAADDWFRPCEDVVELDAIRARYGIPPGPYLLSVCTLAPHKNLAHVIRCFSRLVAEEGIRDLNLVLVGAKGWNYDSIFNAIDFAPGTRERIIVTGYVPDEDLSPLYSGALAFVFCSLYEGFGLPPLEAMQCGVPVITSNTSSLPEVVGEAGMMVDPSDEDQLCQAMLDVYEDSDLRTSLKSKSVARAAQSSWERCVGQVIEGYKRALA